MKNDINMIIIMTYYKRLYGYYLFCYSDNTFYFFIDERAINSSFAEYIVKKIDGMSFFNVLYKRNNNAVMGFLYEREITIQGSTRELYNG